MSSLTEYEAWVRSLRAWQRDPLTDMSQLPAIDAASFPPATFDRFLKRLNEAIGEFMRRWQDQLATSLGKASDLHAMARVLVHSREGLVMRLRLAQHPGLPQQIREALTDQASAEIRDLQQQLEKDAATRVSRMSGSSRPEQESALKLFRDNALTAVLDPGFSLDGSVQDAVTRAAEAVEHNPSQTLTDFVPARRTRRLL
ncbi:hypothetical protein [Nesterenkonia muleiensis]|uniref:hypothetical protein n=1 Tax=Nesterenkonia muleiensis TaxID=2282648 RepID=UPI001300ABAF|nr:hypothetical protein [Nesterenkonia muleiensis]